MESQQIFQLFSTDHIFHLFWGSKLTTKTFSRDLIKESQSLKVYDRKEFSNEPTSLKFLHHISVISVPQIRLVNSKDSPSEACRRRLNFFFSAMCIKKTSLKHTHLSLSNKINLRITQAAQIFINKYLEGMNVCSSGNECTKTNNKHMIFCYHALLATAWKCT